VSGTAAPVRPVPAAGARAALPATRVRERGSLDFAAAWAEMRAFTAGRGPETADEIWLLEHPPVYTLGLAGRPEHLPAHTTIPVARIDRGGQVTYHGPGQLVMYTLIDLVRRGIGIRRLVDRLEESVIRLLAAHDVTAARRPGAPGVYVDGAKIAALGLRVRRAGCYHGLALNVDMDLAPFAAIDPCGMPGLAVTQTAALGIRADRAGLGVVLAGIFLDLLEEAR